MEECPFCKTENRDGAELCSNCGKELNLLAQTPATSIGSHVLTSGAQLQGGRYVIKKVLGQGGMGTALLATDIRLDNKLIVIKELISDHTDPAKLQEDVRNFRREVATLARINHPFVPNVTDSFSEGSQGNIRYFMAQEYIEGENLEDRMERTNQPMQEHEVLNYASQVLDVLDYLAQQTPPIVHRDIKPANIVIGTKDKRAHLVDFGIARDHVARNPKHKQTSALGTLGYAPPEQYQGNANPRSDLYALAATLHYLLTNSDPRNYSPFRYPSVRSVSQQQSPQPSPEIDKVLTKALNYDINQRYQSASVMKHEIDNILLNNFGHANTIKQPQQRRKLVYPSSGVRFLTRLLRVQFGQLKLLIRSKGRAVFNLMLLLIVVFWIGAGLLAIPYISAIFNPRTAVTTSSASSLIRTYKSSINGELIGLSNGASAFATNGADGSLKLQAAQKLADGDPSSAQSLWSQALLLPDQSNDAEVLIYQEDQRVLASNKPYITIVVGTIMTGANAGVGLDNLQGAYIAQKEYNDGSKLPNSVDVFLLIANAGSDARDANTVAQQIVQAAQLDKTIVGVMGWPFSSHMLDAIGTLAAAHIPMVSPSASTDALTGKSSYFFRIVPSNQGQAIADAGYIEQSLHAKTVALFIDPVNAYSASLGNDFKQKFTADGNTIVVTENYVVGQTGNFNTLLQDALSHNPQVIYFSGYASDVGVLLTDLPVSGPPIMGGDALYELSGYPTSARVNFNKLHFTAFAHPDEWAFVKVPKPAFFTYYSQNFDPNDAHTSNPYHYSRPDSDAILSYDAMQALLNATAYALTGTKTTLTPADLQLALTKITGTNAIQGVSGQIAFGPDGNPTNKAFVIIQVTPDNTLQVVSVQGCYTKGTCSYVPVQ